MKEKPLIKKLEESVDEFFNSPLLPTDITIGQLLNRKKKQCKLKP